MTRVLFYILICSLLLLSSCSGRKKRLNHKNMIPEKELIKILTDTYIADGILALPTIRNWYTAADSLSTYNKVIEQHGYTKEAMDRTMKYYFIKKPKELVGIYDRVLGNLSEMESLVEKEMQLHIAQTSEYWKGKTTYILPDPGGNDSTAFDINIPSPGFYSLKFTATIFPSDELDRPRLFGYTCHSDSSETGKRDYLNTIEYIKDGQPHNYHLKINVTYDRPLRLKGWFINLPSYPESLEKHAIIKAISLTYSTAPV